MGQINHHHQLHPYEFSVHFLCANSKQAEADSSAQRHHVFPECLLSSDKPNISAEFMVKSVDLLLIGRL